MAKFRPAGLHGWASLCTLDSLLPGVNTGVSRRWRHKVKAGRPNPHLHLGTSKAGHTLNEKFWRNDSFKKIIVRKKS